MGGSAASRDGLLDAPRIRDSGPSPTPFRLLVSTDTDISPRESEAGSSKSLPRPLSAFARICICLVGFLA